MKSYHADKYMPFDVSAVMFYMLGGYHYNEIQRGYAGIGEYRLKQEFYSDLHVEDLSHVVMRPSAIFSELIAKARELTTGAMTGPTCRPELLSKRAISAPPVTPLLSPCARAEPPFSTAQASPPPVSELPTPHAEESTPCEPRSTVPAEDFTVNQEFNAWLVRGSRGDPHMVTLKPWYCRCPAKSTNCSHRPAKKAVGDASDEECAAKKERRA